jgi:glycerophosphoryl diester phosphodiesterase
MQLPLTVPHNFRIIAHRGASGYAPENTLAAFRLAAEMGIAEIELDVWLSRDSHIVICHDGSLDRYGYPGLHVTRLNLEALLKLDMGSWFSPHFFSGERMLTLEALFTQFRDRFVYHVEIKEPLPGLVRKLLATINAHGLEARVIITSKHINSLIKAKRAAPQIRTGWLVPKGRFSKKQIDRAADAGLFQICPTAQNTTRAMVAAAHSRLPEVRAWAVSGIEPALQAIDSGCDGFTINWPDWFVHQK